MDSKGGRKGVEESNVQKEWGIGVEETRNGEHEKRGGERRRKGVEHISKQRS